ncbi:MAG: hypothetical protein LBU70_08340 [Chitinispirillales bacterium]|nr:hypothetical protein [Chitinispirillales bacterium]
MKIAFAATMALLLILPAGLSAQGVVITSPEPWATLRTDSVVVSFQADTSILPRGSVDFRVVRSSRGRETTLFTQNVKAADLGAEVFLGRVRANDIPLGGTDFMSIMWSIPGSDLRGSIKPIGIAKLSGEAIGGKWIPAYPPLSAVRIADGASMEEAAAAFTEATGFEVGGMRVAVGWNTEAFFINLPSPPSGVTEVEFALDLRCGKNAFLAWADRFVVYDAASSVVSLLRYERSVSGAIGYKSVPWGGGAAFSFMKGESANLVKIFWHEMGIQPFDERGLGFAVFVGGRAGQPANYPAGARRDIPGTWGDIRLEK